MNILMINPAHPSTPHISATRAWQFSRELAKSGHRVVLLCSANKPEQINDGSDLNDHDWSQPYVLAPSMLNTSLSRLPGAIRKFETMALMVLFGGRQWRWQRAAVNSMSQLKQVFMPDVIWATFGKMESVFAAKQCSRLYSVPWVLDLKDSWKEFVPFGLRKLMAFRISGYSSVMGNAQCTIDAADMLTMNQSDVIYSGIDDAYFSDQSVNESGSFRINIIGGLYSNDAAASAVEGIRDFITKHLNRKQRTIHVCYMGADGQRFDRLMCEAGIDVYASNKGYLDINQMAALCKTSAANMYICNNTTFHHKLLELISCGRPIIAYGGEIEEARNLAIESQCLFNEPHSSHELSAILSNIYNHDVELYLPKTFIDKYRWAGQARLLESIFLRVLHQ